MQPEARIAFVADALPVVGGAERVLFTALEAFPRADLFALVYNQDAFRNTPLAHHPVRTSFLDRLPFVHTQHRLLLPLMPAVVERFELDSYDVVVSFSYAVAHGVHAPRGARHVSYTYTPMRYAWNDLNVHGRHARQVLPVRLLWQAFRSWDRRAAARVHEFAAISRAIQERIRHAYGREARLLHPPVEVERFSAAQARGNYYVTLSRLVPHKRLDLVVQAFGRLKLPLVLIGEGPERPRLERQAAPNIALLGHVSDPEVAALLGRARGFVCAAEEDFGIAMVEAQAAGCPVIAYRAGGALETVLEGRTGLYFTQQSVDALMDAVQEFERRRSEFRPSDLIENAGRFSKQNFQQAFVDFVLGSAGGQSRNSFPLSEPAAARA